MSWAAEDFFGALSSTLRVGFRVQGRIEVCFAAGPVGAGAVCCGLICCGLGEIVGRAGFLIGPLWRGRGGVAGKVGYVVMCYRRDGCDVGVMRSLQVWLLAQSRLIALLPSSVACHLVVHLTQ